MSAAAGANRRLLPKEIESIVIIAPTWLGDLVMATPAIARLRRARPDAQIALLCEPAFAPVVAGLPIVDTIVPVAGKGLRGPWKTAAAIRGASSGTPRDTTAVILFPNSFRSACAAWLSRSKVRAGRSRESRQILLTHAIPDRSRAERKRIPRSTVDFYDDLIVALTGDDESAPTMQLAVTDADRVAAEQALGENVDSDEGLLVLIPGGNRATKRWPPESFASVATELARTHGLTVVVSGSPAEADVIAEVSRHINAIAPDIAPRVIDLQARGGGLPAVKGVIARARLVLTNDTGPRHLAAALGTPAVALFGPTDPRWTDLPQAPERVLAAMPFLPPEIAADSVPGLCRIDRIPDSDVRFAAESLLAI